MSSVSSSATGSPGTSASLFVEDLSRLLPELERQSGPLQSSRRPPRSTTDAPAPAQNGTHDKLAAVRVRHERGRPSRAGRPSRPRQSGKSRDRPGSTPNSARPDPAGDGRAGRRSASRPSDRQGTTAPGSSSRSRFRIVHRDPRVEPSGKPQTTAANFASNASQGGPTNMNDHEEPSSEPTMPLERVPLGTGAPPDHDAVGTTPPAKPRADESKRLLADRTTGWVTAGVLACAVVGLSVALATTSSSPTAAFRNGVTAPGRRSAVAPTPGRSYSGGGPFAGRFGPGAGGVSGTVDSVSASKFTMTTSTGRSSPWTSSPPRPIARGRARPLPSAVTHGAHVIVVGSTSGPTIKATQVVVLPAGGGYFGFPGRRGRCDLEDPTPGRARHPRSRQVTGGAGPSRRPAAEHPSQTGRSVTRDASRGNARRHPDRTVLVGCRRHVPRKLHPIQPARKLKRT